MARTIFGGRYLLIMMGLWSIYTGLLYNEVFAVPIDLCGSNWSYPTSNSTEAVLINPSRTYEFGVDPAWKTASNSLLYYNSLKMKMSIIMGVTQMTLGIIISFLNALYFKKIINILGEFIPQIIFLLGIFGYMSFLIIYKWCNSWISINNNAPMLLNVMINMFLEPYAVTSDYAVFNANTQLTVQLILLALCFISVPWMLLAKPLYLRKKHKDKLKMSPELLNEHQQAEHDDGHGGSGPVSVFLQTLLCIHFVFL